MSRIVISAEQDRFTMLTAKSPAGVAPNMNLRNLLFLGNKKGKEGIHRGFETYDKCQVKFI